MQNRLRSSLLLQEKITGSPCSCVIVIQNDRAVFLQKRVCVVVCFSSTLIKYIACWLHWRVSLSLPYSVVENSAGTLVDGTRNNGTENSPSNLHISRL